MNILNNCKCKCHFYFLRWRDQMRASVSQPRLGMFQPLRLQLNKLTSSRSFLSLSGWFNSAVLAQTPIQADSFKFAPLCFSLNCSAWASHWIYCLWTLHTELLLTHLFSLKQNKKQKQNQTKQPLNGSEQNWTELNSLSFTALK